MKQKFKIVILILLVSVQLKAQPFNTIADFMKHLNEICSIEDETERESNINTFWSYLRSGSDIPFTIEDSVVFLYRGNASSVSWAGDMNGWQASNANFKGEKIGLSNVWYNLKKYPSDSRIDYKIVLNGTNWILDPDNPYKQMSGFGWNSELRMPDWIKSPFITLMDGVNRGNLSANIRITSSFLGYDVNYKVYTPFNYENFSKLPVVYVTDGHENANDDMGSMIIILDNLIHLGLIQPIIAVFIDPRNPNNTSQNRRENEYTCNPDFADFVANELVPKIDGDYNTNAYPNARGIMGTSYGGNNAGYFAAKKYNKFGLIMAHSPAFFDETFNLFQIADKLPVSIFMTTGTIHDTYDYTLQMRNILDNKGYEYQYLEVSEGHSWGNWRALIDDMLIHFFSEPLSVAEHGEDLNTWSLFPNPTGDGGFNLVTNEDKKVNIDLYGISGKRIADFGTFDLKAGEIVSISKDLDQGIYFFRIDENDQAFSIKFVVK